MIDGNLAALDRHERSCREAEAEERAEWEARRPARALARWAAAQALDLKRAAEDHALDLVADCNSCAAISRPTIDAEKTAHYLVEALDGNIPHRDAYPNDDEITAALAEAVALEGAA